MLVLLLQVHTFEELEIEDFDWIFSINFMGVVLTSNVPPFYEK
jgi:hypothetical protein